MRIPLCYLFLLLRTFYVSIFRYKIDSLEEYSLATDIATSFTCFKPQYYTRKSSFYLFSMVENPVKSRITKSRWNLEKHEGVHLTLPPHIISIQLKSRSMLHHGSIGASLKQNKRNLILTLTLTLNVLLPCTVFHNKI